jgi:asparagine synthase (glutamine-hydrolysing)
MCGFFGWMKFEGPFGESEIAHSRTSVEKLIHRGPDASGEWIGGGIYLGHRRLKILDLSDQSAQPFLGGDNRYVIAYNGEIYNYIEIREELKKEGFSFRSSADTEVFLAAFSHWGEKAFLRFDGMFSAAIFDNQTRKLFLVRDPLGQKPLYYYQYKEGIVFASELRALIEHKSFTWSIDKENLSRYLLNSYYVWDNTPLKGVKKLLPGNFLEVKSEEIKLKRYWCSRPGEETLNISADEALDELDRLLDRSCRMSLRSDVPYGVFLSGGTDSSLILKYCIRHNREIASFSVKMGEKDFDESEKAITVAQHLGVRHSSIFSLNEEKLVEVFREFLENLDEPHGDPGFVNSLFLAKSSRPYITVAIAGDGGDELFAGYAPFKGLWTVPYVDKLSLDTTLLLKKIVEKILPGSDGYLTTQFKALCFLQGFPAHPSIRYALWLSALSMEEMKSLCPHHHSGFFDRFGSPGSIFGFMKDSLTAMEGSSIQQQLLYYYQNFFLPEFVALHTDRAAMLTSMEVRSPFLSSELIRFANRLPDQFKFKSGQQKWILKQLLKFNYFPNSIVNQRKRGFTFPVARWLKSNLKPNLELLIKDDSLFDEFLDKATLVSMIEKHLSGKRNYYRILFNLITFRAWKNNFPSLRLS